MCKGTALRGERLRIVPWSCIMRKVFLSMKTHLYEVKDDAVCGTNAEILRC